MRVQIDRLSYRRERDYNYGRSRYDSNSDIGGKRDDKWTRRDSSDHVRDKKCLSLERDQCPHRRCKRSQYSGHDDRQRSRSPQVCTRGRSHQDNYGKDRHNKSEGHRNRDDRQSHEHSSITLTATVEVKGLSKQTTVENIHQILAEWRPFLHVRVMRRRKSSVCRGIAFIDFPSVAAAQKMMDVVGDCGLDVNGQKLSFEYSQLGKQMIMEERSVWQLLRKTLRLSLL
ncbi:SUPPRESSOR OF ABI3-5-like [Papaver somniferum]|uniref:SUPPRESSOR OF ABI3-5-like n=1 Tax=Papaver somniferum TaxID=3469 RepID=UPI000E6FDB1B|nr:SUPPRESSOR OF ABI3-5-like [Papaver somniferum]